MKISRLGIFALLLVAARLVLMVFFPVIGDEAYYFYWGRHFSGGYYDLSPMIGWWEAAISLFSLHPFWLRAPNFFALAAVSFGLYEWMLPFSKARAQKTAALFFFLPIPFLAVIVSPDVPLLFFSFFAALLFFQQRALPLFFAGVLWGAAFLSKYFALFLLPPFAIWFLIQKKRNYWGLVVFVLGALPFLFQHGYWNAAHCWSNVVFNWVTRQAVNDGNRWVIIALFLLYLVLLATPFLLRRMNLSTQINLNHDFERIEHVKQLRRYVGLLWVIPISIFAFTALAGKGQGLHWYLSFTPFFVAWVALGMRDEGLTQTLRQLMVTTAVLISVALAVSISPENTIGRFFEKRFTYDFNLIAKTEKFVLFLKPHLKGADLILTDGYSLSAVLDHALRQEALRSGEEIAPVSILGEGSRFGRVFDWTINWLAYEGKQIVMVTSGPPDLSRYRNYFRMINRLPYEFGDGPTKTTVYITVGTGFSAAQYREEVLRPAFQQYYPVEKLPFQTAGCSP